MTPVPPRINALTLFGLGYLRYSASLASLIAILVYVAIRSTFEGYWQPYVALLVVAVIASALSSAQTSYVKDDPKEAVIDEFLAMLACVCIAGTLNVLMLLLLFVVFRVLDILKPFPFNWIDKNAHGPFGYLVDDLAICVPLGVLVLLLAQAKLISG